jgi:hypothetical protein
MAKGHKSNLETPAPILDEEDDETLAAIDEGIRDRRRRTSLAYGKSPGAFTHGDYRLLYTQTALKGLAGIVGHVGSRQQCLPGKRF